ncbi:hypothetical protein GOP47_0026462 [Adiantum capillus-veneris]|nr:hypothetical protein GOP47_0026462 [Adiantum capillus-veneris]
MTQDEPPELEDMSNYVANICQNKNVPATFSPKRTTDSTTLNQACQEAKPDEMFNTLKKGFLNSSYEKNRGQERRRQEMPFLQGSKQTKHPKAKDIPDLLEPTKEIVQDVMDNEVIKSGLEDPVVMAAVQEIAGNADSIHKYRNDPKVVSFYSQLGKLMGDKIQQQEKNKCKERDCST